MTKITKDIITVPKNFAEGVPRYIGIACEIMARTGKSYEQIKDLVVAENDKLKLLEKKVMCSNLARIQKEKRIAEKEAEAIAYTIFVADMIEKKTLEAIEEPIIKGGEVGGL